MVEGCDAMRGVLKLFVVVVLVTLITFFSGCGRSQDVFYYQGILFEGFDPMKHQPSKEFGKYVRLEKVILSPKQVKSLKRCVDLLKERNLLFLLEYADRFVVANSPYSFADKPQMIIYLDKEKVTLGFSIGDDWKNKLLNSNLNLMENSGRFSFKGTPDLPNLLRIILHETGHLVEYDKLKFNWKGKFVDNVLNKDFVNISWDRKQHWKDKEGFSEKLQSIYSVDALVAFLLWFQEESSFFSLSSSMGMNEDFAEAFVYYFLSKEFNYTIDFILDDSVVINNLQKTNSFREKKFKFISEIIEEGGYK
jgi:hypothetical protein